MEPLHAIEYELTSELATKVQRTLVPWELRRGWRRDVPLFAGAVVFAALIIWLGLEGWILPGVGGGLICLLALFVIGAIYRRVWSARGAAMSALLALHTSDRRVRIEFSDERVRLEAESFRGEGAWTELDEVNVFPGFWLLQLSSGGQILVPDSLVSPELEAFIRAKAQQVMAPVRQG
ncbi:MAG: YcxB family protein [Planctomycetes bacterium]|nr:YcxB family protein [Planctomycetota bacterium]